LQSLFASGSGGLYPLHHAGNRKTDAAGRWINGFSPQRRKERRERISGKDRRREEKATASGKDLESQHDVERRDGQQVDGVL
jgi:hypothetical protein